jgi:hypothetical protein
MEGGVLAIDESGLYGSRFVATDEGFAIEEVVANDQGLVNQVVVGRVLDEDDDDTE